MKILFCFILSLVLASFEGMAIDYLAPASWSNSIAFAFGAMTGVYGMVIGIRWQLGD